jgi:membrane protease subunit HflK
MMDRIKAASISLVVIVLITGLKFILYYCSGSIAVLSEAWHSFSDIATTLLVLLSILRQRRKDAGKEMDTPAPSSVKVREVNQRQFIDRFGKADTELKVAGTISLVLLSVSFLILKRAIFAEPVAVEMPLVTGIIFVGLSFGSFFLYRFQDTIGREGNSAALRADSLHNRADMAISLLTGASLILYHFGYDLDRWVSVYIAIFIFSFALEMLVNVVVSIMNGGTAGLVSEYRFNDICRAAFRYDTYVKLVKPIVYRVPLSRNKKMFLDQFPQYLRVIRKWAMVLVFVVLSLGCLKTMVYTVPIDEEALVLRFGQMVGPDRMMGPGLHWKLPWPIDRVVRFQTRKVFSLAVGNTAGMAEPMIWSYDHGDTKTFISGDNNLFLPYLIVHYRIKNPRHYYLHYRSGAADKLLEYQAYRILSRTFVTKDYFDIALFQRRDWTETAANELQKKLDGMEAGFEIVAFCLRDLHPPRDIAASYENVVAAYQNREQHLNNARRYYSTKLPEASTKANRTMNEAYAEAVSRLRLAEGEAENYRMRLEGFKAGGDIGKHLLTFEAAKKNLKGKKLFLIDPRSGIDARMVYFENHISKEQAK